MKKRKVSEIVSDYTEEELEYASELAGKKDKTTNLICMTELEALSLYLDLDLSDEKYNLLRKTVNRHHEKLFPSLYALKNFKNNILPLVKATESTAEVELKPLLRNTAQSVLKLCDAKESPEKVTLICKWGMDGSSRHSRYKINFSSEEFSDEYMFLIAFVPLE